jgi:diguanylate cyclase (GGDEF)-like protein
MVVVFGAVARGYSLERRVRREMAVAATAERWRSRILEEINRVRPLPEIITRIVDLVSYKLKGTPCWSRLASGETLGNPPANLNSSTLTICEQEIPSRTGAVLGTMYAGVHANSGIRAAAPDALFSAAQLAALAIETRGLYLDLVHRSEFDQLTDIYNRFSLEKQLDRLIEGERQEDSSFGLIYIDLNDFKLVNDQYGHSAGDQYLQEAARRMNAQLRPGDMLARLGGDEFAAIVPVVRSRADVAEIAARLEHCFEKPFELEECTIRGSTSVGIALYPDDGGDRESLLSAADAAMYVAKNTRHG